MVQITIIPHQMTCTLHVRLTSRYGKEIPKFSNFVDFFEISKNAQFWNSSSRNHWSIILDSYNWIFTYEYQFTIRIKNSSFFSSNLHKFIDKIWGFFPILLNYFFFYHYSSTIKLYMAKCCPIRTNSVLVHKNSTHPRQNHHELHCINWCFCLIHPLSPQ